MRPPATSNTSATSIGASVAAWRTYFEQHALVARRDRGLLIEESGGARDGPLPPSSQGVLAHELAARLGRLRTDLG